MQWVIAAIAAVVLVADSASAVGIASCAAIDDDGKRLECYDEVAGRVTEQSEPESPGSDLGDWIVDAKPSKFDDRQDVTLGVVSLESPQCKWGDAFARLIIRCRENTTSIILSTPDCHLASGHGGYGNVDVRIDDRKATVWRMEEATNNRALGLWFGRNSIPRAKQLIGAETLLMRFTPYGENPRTVEFPLAGLENAIEPLRKACGW